MIGVSDAAMELESIDMAGLISGSIKKDDLDDLARHFVHTFNALADVMRSQETKKRMNTTGEAIEATSKPISSGETSKSLKRNAKKTSSTKRNKRPKTKHQSSVVSSEPATPDQPTFPANADYSGTSIESKDEENTKMLLKNFLSYSMTVLRSDFREITWSQSNCTVELILR